jgi:hypothetical protein
MLNQSLIRAVERSLAKWTCLLLLVLLLYFNGFLIGMLQAVRDVLNSVSQGPEGVHAAR